MEQKTKVSGKTVQLSENKEYIIKLEEELKVAKDAIEEGKQYYEEYKNKYLRALADYDNYKKNNIKERSNFMKYREESIAKDLISLYEDISRSLEAEEVSEGTKAIYEKFIRTLSDHKITKMDINKGDSFNVNFMNAVSSVPTNNKDLDCTVCDILSPCFILIDKVIKYAQVVVYAYSA